jgi:hypothetical protein
MLATVVPALIVGCAAAPTGSEGNPALGIAEFQSTHSATGLVIAGLDAAGDPIGRVEVKVGAFVMSDAFAEDRVGAMRDVDGRRVDIEFRGVRLHHESEGHDPLRLPFPPLAQYEEMQAFVADSHVLPLLENQGVSFRFRPSRATAINGKGFSSYAVTRCSSYDSHHLGPGGDCQQYSGNDPNGFDTNTCATRGAASLGCTDTSIADPSLYSGFFTDLYQCCDGTADGTGISAVEKTCVPQAKGVSPCGTGGGVGCAACWFVDNTSSCSNWCEGSGDDCDEDNRPEACSDAESGIHLDFQ